MRNGRFSQAEGYQRNFVPAHPSSQMPRGVPARLCLRLLLRQAVSVTLVFAGPLVAVLHGAHLTHLATGAALCLIGVVGTKRVRADAQRHRRSSRRPRYRAFDDPRFDGIRTDRPRY
ncbi:hypothetical protein [Pseudooceanicola spongiae]|uniref:Uncharacterized protein n=1 Tax=Pseudooceanicola spongiae TaxID=2613965 RepID=A0A7L9WIW7_9RHOB|nr:hypothetical protein [Pseudooceanicola spongiae]QOL79774.1 hypothetical protein F3W81_02435 [Pseudooceanicola spongiae]